MNSTGDDTLCEIASTFGHDAAFGCTVIVFHPIVPILRTLGVPEAFRHQLDPAQCIPGEAIQP